MIKKNLLIVGAGDFGREMESWLQLIPSFSNEWNIIGYLDDNENALNGYPSDYKVIGKPLSYSFKQGDYALVCITNPLIKEKIVKHLDAKVNFLTYVAPNVIVGKFCEIGRGCIICPNSGISTNVVVGEFTTINGGSQIGHDCVIGSFNSIMANVDLGGKVKIGKGVFIGTNATLIPGISVEDNIRIGAGSIVVRNLKRAGTYFGNPAKFLSE